MNYLKKLILRDDLMNIFFPVYSFFDSLILIFLLGYIRGSFFPILSLPILSRQNKILIAVILVLGWILSVFIVSMLQSKNLNKTKHYLGALGTSGVIYGIITVSLISVNDFMGFSFVQALLVFVYSFIILLISRMAFFMVYKITDRGYRKRKKIVIIGSNATARRLIDHFSDKSVSTAQVEGLFDARDNFEEEYIDFYLGELNDVKSYCLEHKVDEIYYTLANHKGYLNELRSLADENYIFLGIVPDLDIENDFKLRTHVIDHHGIPVVSYERTPLSSHINRFTKRSFDIVVSSIVLILLSLTLFPVIAIMIKMDSKGPIFFKQLRTGKSCRTFWCYKFRTMTVNNEAHLKQATRDDKRVTAVGRFLRKTSLDELPQFFNALRGDMSIVGPRPHMIVHTDQYTREFATFKIRHAIEAGITGYAQVNGFRGEIKEPWQMEKRVLFDKYYLENWSILLDLQIIYKTIITLFKGENTAY